MFTRSYVAWDELAFGMKHKMALNSSSSCPNLPCARSVPLPPVLRHWKNTYLFVHHVCIQYPWISERASKPMEQLQAVMSHQVR